MKKYTIIFSDGYVTRMAHVEALSEEGAGNQAWDLSTSPNTSLLYVTTGHAEVWDFSYLPLHDENV